MKKICVFCGSSYGIDPVYRDAAKELGEVFLKNDMALVYGGAKVGLMGELADLMLRSGSYSAKLFQLCPSRFRQSE